MKINIKRNWFTSSAEFFQPHQNPITVPEGLEDQLPKDAEILPEPKIEMVMPTVLAKPEKK